METLERIAVQENGETGAFSLLPSLSRSSFIFHGIAPILCVTTLFLPYIPRHRVFVSSEGHELRDQRRHWGEGLDAASEALLRQSAALRGNFRAHGPRCYGAGPCHSFYACSSSAGPEGAVVDKGRQRAAQSPSSLSPLLSASVMVVDGKRAGGKSAAQQRIRQRAENEAKLAASSAIVDDLKQAVRQQDAPRNPGASVFMSATTARLALKAARGSPQTHSRTLGDNGAEAGPSENNAGAGGSDSMADNVGAAEVSDLRAAEKRQRTMQKTVVGTFGPESACRLRDICHQLDIRFEVALGEAEHHLRQLASTTTLTRYGP